MHDHNKKNENNGNKGMMWMMILCFLLLGILFLGGGKLSSGGYLWPVLIGVFVVAHIWMMFKGHGGHGGHNDTNTEDKVDDTSVKQLEKKDEDNKHKHGGGCH